MIADAGLHGINRGAGMHRDVLADHTMMTDFKRRFLAGKACVLRWGPKDGKRVNLAIRTQCRSTFDNNMRMQGDTVAKHDIGPDHTIGSDADLLAKGGTGIDNRG